MASTDYLSFAFRSGTICAKERLRNPLADSYRRFRRITHAGLPIAGVGGDRSVIEQAQPPALEWFLRWGRLAPTYFILTDDARHRGGGGSAAAEKLQKVERVERINAADEHERAVDSREVERPRAGDCRG